ncbi:MAG: FMN-binding negative transcriptional regulator [Pararhodobacter sp.]
MYTPTHFQETDEAEIARLVTDHPLAAVVAQTAQGLLVNHLPLLRDGAGFTGHVARANPMHAEIPEAAPVVAIFTAAEGYVSPNWYPSKAETHRAVPTWNYQVVHVHGHLSFSHAERDKRRAVSLLTSHHERRVNGNAGWRMGDAPPDFLATMLDNIVACHLHVDRIEAKSKLNQNRAEADIRAVAEAADQSGNARLSAAMRRILPVSPARG